MESEALLKKQLLSRLDHALIRRIKIDAAERGRTASSIVEEALTEYYARRDKTKGSMGRKTS